MPYSNDLTHQFSNSDLNNIYNAILQNGQYVLTGEFDNLDLQKIFWAIMDTLGSGGGGGGKQYRNGLEDISGFVGLNGPLEYDTKITMGDNTVGNPNYIFQISNSDADSSGLYMGFSNKYLGQLNGNQGAYVGVHKPLSGAPRAEMVTSQVGTNTSSYLKADEIAALIGCQQGVNTYSISVNTMGFASLIAWEVRFSNHPGTRRDNQMAYPIGNILYTDSMGFIRSTSLNALIAAMKIISPTW